MMYVICKRGNSNSLRKSFSKEVLTKRRYHKRVKLDEKKGREGTEDDNSPGQGGHRIEQKRV